MGKFILGTLLLGAWILGLAAPAEAKPPYKVWGYVMAGDLDPRTGLAINYSLLPWADLTNVMDAFALPSATAGKITTAGLNGASLITLAHGNSVRCNMSIGGASPAANTTRFAASVATPALIATFVANITSTAGTMGYDGVDIDWEFPTAAQKANFMSFMQALYAAIKAMPACAVDGKPHELTFFISAGGSICGVDWSTIGNDCDSGIMSGYDYFIDVYNGPLAGEGTYTDCNNASATGDIVGTYGKIHAAGMPANKLSLGCPLYGNLLSSGNEVEIINILQNGAAGAYQSAQAEQLYSYSGDLTTADTAQSYCDKINWALAQGMQGIGLWELAQAYPPTDPLVSGLWNTIGGNNGCLVLGSPTATPTRTPAAATATLTITPTGTWSRTPTLTAAAGTATASITATGTRSASPTPTSAAPTATPSITITTLASRTSTPTPPAGTATLTITPTGTWSRTPTLTAVAGTATLTITPTWTASRTPTLTTVAPGSATDSPTPAAGSPTPTATPDAQTATATLTPQTPSATATLTSLGGGSATDTPDISATPTQTPNLQTPTLTLTTLAAGSATDTPDISATATPSPPATPGASPTPFSGTPYGPPHVDDGQACPNPAHGGHWGFALRLSTPADGLEAKVYTPALVLAAKARLSGGWGKDWGQASFSVDLPPGLYYVVVRASRGGACGGDSRIIRVVALP